MPEFNGHVAHYCVFASFAVLIGGDYLRRWLIRREQKRADKRVLRSIVNSLERQGIWHWQPRIR